MQERELIQGLQKREEAAFQQLVALYKDRLYNTTLGFIQNEAEAEDVTQEIFIKAFQSVQQFKGEAALSTWLYRIAVTQSLDFLRKRQRQKNGLLQQWFGKKESRFEEPDFHHPGVAIEKKETAAVLFKAIRQLPESQQTAFLLQKNRRVKSAGDCPHYEG